MTRAQFKQALKELEKHGSEEQTAPGDSPWTSRGHPVLSSAARSGTLRGSHHRAVLRILCRVSPMWKPHQSTLLLSRRRNRGRVRCRIRLDEPTDGPGGGETQAGGAGRGK